MKKKALLIVPALALVVGISACGGNSVPSGQQKETKAQQADQTNLENNQPLPNVNYSQERQNLIDIELAEVNNVQTTTFIKALGNVDPIFSCPSIGFGIPESASLSNPDQISYAYNSWNNGQMDSGVIAQMDPNGIYAPTTGQGTFVVCLYSNGQPYINRFEDNADTVGGPAEWDYTHHEIVVTGAPTALGTVIDKSRETKMPASKATTPAK